MKDFRDQYMQTFPAETDFERKLRELGEEYHEVCEGFDRTRCLARDKYGNAVPVNRWEMAQINQHARKVREEIEIRAARFGATREQVWKAIQRAAR